MSQMDDHHRRDYQAQRLFDDARRSISDVLNSTEAAFRLSVGDQETLMAAADLLKHRSAHIVAVWD